MRIGDPELRGRTIEIEGWWLDVAPDKRRWPGNPAFLRFVARLIRGAYSDNGLLYGRVDGRGVIVDVSEVSSSASPDGLAESEGQDRVQESPRGDRPDAGRRKAD
ncbi:MAG: hypothetical protein QOI95_2057 [Acidimicrobiaceae bacterium]